jgi:hypothetical protein
MDPIVTAANEITTTNASTSVPAPTLQSSDNRDFWAQIRPHFTHIPERIKPQIEFVPKLLFALLNVSLLIGGLVFLIYFATIGFMPEIDATASITLLTVSAITGAGLLIMLGLAFIAPSYVWIWWTIVYEPVKLLWFDQEGKFSHRRAKLWFCLPLIGVLGGLFSLPLV